MKIGQLLFYVATENSAMNRTQRVKVIAASRSDPNARYIPGNRRFAIFDPKKYFPHFYTVITNYKQSALFREVIPYSFPSFRIYWNYNSGGNFSISPL